MIKYPNFCLSIKRIPVAKYALYLFGLQMKRKEYSEVNNSKEVSGARFGRHLIKVYSFFLLVLSPKGT